MPTAQLHTAAPSQTIEVPARYAGLGVEIGFDPTKFDRLRIILAGLSGSGKTSLVAGDPHTLLLDFDRAANNAFGARAARAPLTTWEEYEKLRDALCEDRKANSANCPWTRVTFDTTDAFMTLLDQHLIVDTNKARVANGNRAIDTMTEFGQEGAGYTKLSAAIRREIATFEQAGFAWTLVCHLKKEIEKIGEDTIVRNRAVLFPSSWTPLASTSDLIGVIGAESRSRKKQVVQTLPNGTKRTVDAGVETYYVHTLDIKGVAQANDNVAKRRLLDLEASFDIPPVGGWDVACRGYNEAITALLAKAAVPAVPSPAPK